MTPTPFPVRHDDGRTGVARSAGLSGTYCVVEIAASDGTTDRVEIALAGPDRGAVGWWFHDSGMWIQLGDHWTPSETIAAEVGHSMDDDTPCDPVMVGVPETPTPEMINAVRTHPSTATDKQDEMHLRIGWLLVAWRVMIDAHISTKRP